MYSSVELTRKDKVFLENVQGKEGNLKKMSVFVFVDFVLILR